MKDEDFIITAYQLADIIDDPAQEEDAVIMAMNLLLDPDKFKMAVKFMNPNSTLYKTAKHLEIMQCGRVMKKAFYHSGLAHDKGGLIPLYIDGTINELSVEYVSKFLRKHSNDSDIIDYLRPEILSLCCNDKEVVQFFWEHLNRLSHDYDINALMDEHVWPKNPDFIRDELYKSCNISGNYAMFYDITTMPDL